MNKENVIIYSLAVCVICLIFWLFPYQIIKYNMLPEHKVYIEWTVYTASGPIDYHGTYDMKGYDFKTQYTSHRGSNTVCVIDDDASFFMGDQSVCIYVGTNDVNVKTIKIVK